METVGSTEESVTFVSGDSTGSGSVSVEDDLMHWPPREVMTSRTTSPACDGTGRHDAGDRSAGVEIAESNVSQGLRGKAANCGRPRPQVPRELKSWIPVAIGEMPTLRHDSAPCGGTGQACVWLLRNGVHFRRDLSLMTRYA